MAEAASTTRAWTPHVSPTTTAAHSRRSLGYFFRSVLDLLIGFYTAGLALIALIGGGDLGFVSDATPRCRDYCDRLAARPAYQRAAKV